MLKLAAHLPALVLLALVPVGCDAPEPAADDASGVGAGGKADGIGGIEEGSAEARAILELVNDAEQDVLDDDVGLDRRAAAGIVETRTKNGPFTTLAQLDAVSFVGASAFAKLLEFVIEQGLVARELRIATFNIRWYGLDGDLFNAFGTESRHDSIRAFMREHLAAHDVVVFQEIVDLELFEEEIMPDHTCVTYDGFTGKHQHVMLCHTDALAFVPEDDDEDFALEALNLGGLRPGLHGKLVAADGDPLAHVVAVHLKAKEDSTEKRLEQAAILSARLDVLAAKNDGLPVVLIGDFNTHRADVTGRAENDEALLAEILEKDDRVHRVEQGVVHTYREKNGIGFRLDQAWLSPDITVTDVAVPGPCNVDFATDPNAIVEYYDTVSDHCPLSLRLELP
jgi:endonuclease/exonuclease/phosphatase family metal-dependent hydrolase